MSTNTSPKKTTKPSMLKPMGSQKQAKSRRTRTAPQLSEKTKKLTLKAFRLAYEQHHPKDPS